MPSAMIASFTYDEESKTLLVVFQSGRRYHYLDVPAELIKELRVAFAKGEFSTRASEEECLQGTRRYVRLRICVDRELARTLQTPAMT
jgi:KTSC domain